MKSVILCEGLTDCLFVQYYLRAAHGWDDSSLSSKISFMRWKRILTKNENSVLIGHNGGCSQLVNMLGDILRSNYISTLEESYMKIVLITDRDDNQSEEDIIEKVKKEIKNNGGSLLDVFENDKWMKVTCTNSIGDEFIISVLLLVVPFDENGAIETVLLNSLADKDSYDKMIIQKSKKFINEIDPNEKYLFKRRRKLKAWFNIYFSVRVPEDFYIERQRIFQQFPWEKHPYLKKIFAKLGDLEEITL